jgi:hypothetical protein
VWAPVCGGAREEQARRCDRPSGKRAWGRRPPRCACPISQRRANAKAPGCRWRAFGRLAHGKSGIGTCRAGQGVHRSKRPDVAEVRGRANCSGRIRTEQDPASPPSCLENGGENGIAVTLPSIGFPTPQPDGQGCGAGESYQADARQGKARTLRSRGRTAQHLTGSPSGRHH